MPLRKPPPAAGRTAPPRAQRGIWREFASPVGHRAAPDPDASAPPAGCCRSRTWNPGVSFAYNMVPVPPGGRTCSLSSEADLRWSARFAMAVERAEARLDQAAGLPRGRRWNLRRRLAPILARPASPGLHRPAAPGGAACSSSQPRRDHPRWKPTLGEPCWSTRDRRRAPTRGRQDRRAALLVCRSSHRRGHRVGALQRKPCPLACRAFRQSAQAQWKRPGGFRAEAKCDSRSRRPLPHGPPGLR